MAHPPPPPPPPPCSKPTWPSVGARVPPCWMWGWCCPRVGGCPPGPQPPPRLRLTRARHSPRQPHSPVGEGGGGPSPSCPPPGCPPGCRRVKPVGRSPWHPPLHPPPAAEPRVSPPPLTRAPSGGARPVWQAARRHPRPARRTPCGGGAASPAPRHPPPAGRWCCILWGGTPFGCGRVLFRRHWLCSRTCPTWPPWPHA